MVRFFMLCFSQNCTSWLLTGDINYFFCFFSQMQNQNLSGRCVTHVKGCRDLRLKEERYLRAAQFLHLKESVRKVYFHLERVPLRQK